MTPEQCQRLRELFKSITLLAHDQMESGFDLRTEVAETVDLIQGDLENIQQVLEQAFEDEDE